MKTLVVFVFMISSVSLNAQDSSSTKFHFSPDRLELFSTAMLSVSSLPKYASSSTLGYKVSLWGMYQLKRRNLYLVSGIEYLQKGAKVDSEISIKGDYVALPLGIAIRTNNRMLSASLSLNPEVKISERASAYLIDLFETNSLRSFGLSSNLSLNYTAADKYTISAEYSHGLLSVLPGAKGFRVFSVGATYSIF